MSDEMVAVFQNGTKIPITHRTYNNLQMTGPGGFFESPMANPEGKKIYWAKQALLCVEEMTGKAPDNLPADPLPGGSRFNDPTAGTIPAHPEIAPQDPDELKAKIYAQRKDKAAPAVPAKLKFEIEDDPKK